MNFERGIDAKESMGVGLTTKAVEPKYCTIGFKMGKKEDINRKSLDLKYLEIFLEMWETNNFSSMELKRILKIQGWSYLAAPIRINDISMDLKNNSWNELYLHVFPGSGESLYIKWQSKIYILPVKAYNFGFIV